MFNKKYIIFYLILLFLFARLYLLFAGLESLIAPYPDDNELYTGTTAKMYMDGSINSLLSFQRTDYNGISTVESLAAIPFFYVFGPYLFSLKLVALTFLLATMVLWFLFIKRHIGTETATITALLFIFAPPSFITYNLACGFHSTPLFFDILAITFFFEMIRNTPPSPLLPKVRSSKFGVRSFLFRSSDFGFRVFRVWGWHILFGIVSGFALWVDNVFAVTLVTCIVFWFIHDKIFFLKRTFAIFVVSFIIGFSIWFYYVIYIRHFQIMNIFSYSSFYPKTIFYKKFWELLTYKLPYSLCFKDYFFSGVFLSYLYYVIFVMAFGGLIWFQRKPIIKMLSSFLPRGWHGQTCLSVPYQPVTVESFLLGYIVIFILIFSLSRFSVGYKSNSPWEYRFFHPLYPFIFVTIAIGLNKLLNIGKTPFKLISCVFIFIFVSAGIMGLASQTNIRDFGKGLTFKGYSYKGLGNTFWIDYNLIVKRANQIDNGLYKNHLCQHWGLKLVLVDKLELSACELLICEVEKAFRPAFYEGVGRGYGVAYDDVFTILKKLLSTNLTNKCYEKYLLYGIAAALPLQGNIDKHISVISQIEPRFQSYFYQGLGVQLAKRMGFTDMDRNLLQIDEANRKYCYIGVGQNIARRLEWAFADKKYYIGFDGLNKDYWPDCYYGLGWGIGDFFEFDMDRYLAIINNNVSQGYMEYCFKGLADRLHWRFVDNAEKFQRVTKLLPKPYNEELKPIAQPCQPVLFGSYDTKGVAVGIYISGSVAYTINPTSGLQIIDVSNPADPTLLGSYDTPGTTYSVYVSGSTAYVADWDRGLQIIDVTNPTEPALLGSYDTPGGTLKDYLAGSTNPPLPTQPPWCGGLDVYVSGSTAYVADGYGGIQVIDVSNPMEPLLLGSYDTPGEALDIYVSGSTAYVADFDGGLQIIDVSNPTAPTWLGSYDIPGYAWGVYVSGSIAYVANKDCGLQIIDVSNPVAPTLLQCYDTPGYAYKVYVSGSTAYVADFDGGLQIIDVSNPTTPIWLGSCDTPGEALDVYVSGSTAYVADGRGGFQIIDVGSCISLNPVNNSKGGISGLFNEGITSHFILDGNTIRFSDESQRKYLAKGWSSTEEWGTWSEGEESLIILNFKEPKNHTMLIKATGFSVPGKQQSVRIYLDDNLLGEHTFSHSTAYFEDFEMKIPATYIKEGIQRIRFVYSFVGRPVDHGMGPDARQLAMGVSSIEFR